ncbi:MAG: hypothetical protein Q8J89_05325 [Caulobacter sp.]|nr:hypothetical protein [Caulobacter sp.]
MSRMRRTTVLFASALSALLLAACAQEAPGGADAPPPADAPAAAASEYAVDFAARGTEPFWRVDVKGTTISITRPEPPEVVATNAALATAGTTGTWTAQAGTTPVVLVVTKGACSDGMSDLKYDYTAELREGDAVFKGCAFPLSAEPREGD